MASCSLVKFFNFTRKPNSSKTRKRSAKPQPTESVVLKPEEDYGNDDNTQISTVKLAKANKLLLVLQLFTFILAIFAIVYFHTQMQQTKFMLDQCFKMNQGLVRKKRSAPHNSVHDCFQKLPLFNSGDFKRQVVFVLIMLYIDDSENHAFMVNPQKVQPAVTVPLKIEHTCKCDVELPDTTFYSQNLAPSKYLELCRNLHHSFVSADAPKIPRKHHIRHNRNKKEHGSTSKETAPPKYVNAKSTIKVTTSPIPSQNHQPQSSMSFMKKACRLEIVGTPVFQGVSLPQTNTWINMEYSRTVIMQNPTPRTLLVYDSISDIIDKNPTVRYLQHSSVSTVIKYKNKLLYVKSKPYEFVSYDLSSSMSTILSVPYSDWNHLDLLYKNSDGIFVDLSLDDYGLWILYRKNDTWTVNLAVLHDNNTVSVIHTVTVSIPYSAAESVIICGVLYIVESGTDKFTSIRHSYDLWDDAKEILVNISWMNVQSSLISANYDAKLQKIKIIDGSGLYLAPMRLLYDD